MNREKKVIILLGLMLIMSMTMNVYQAMNQPVKSVATMHGVRVEILVFYLGNMTYENNVFYQGSGGDFGGNVSMYWLNYTHHMGKIIFSDRMVYFDLDTGFGLVPINRTRIDSY